MVEPYTKRNEQRPRFFQKKHRPFDDHSWDNGTKRKTRRKSLGIFREQHGPDPTAALPLAVDDDVSEEKDPQPMHVSIGHASGADNVADHTHCVTTQDILRRSSQYLPEDILMRSRTAEDGSRSADNKLIIPSEVVRAVYKLQRRFSEQSKTFDEFRRLQRQMQYRHNAVISGVLGLKAPLQSLSSPLGNTGSQLAEHEDEATGSCVDNPDETRQQILTEISYIEGYAREMHELRLMIGASEHQADSAKSEIRKQLKALSALVSPDHASVETDLTSHEIIQKTKSPRRIDPLLAKYFDRKGDIGVLRERLQNLRYDHEAEKADREHREDQGYPVEPSYDVFKRQHEAEVTDYEIQIRQAEDDTRDLGERCREAELDLTGNMVASSTESATSANDEGAGDVAVNDAEALDHGNARRASSVDSQFPIGYNRELNDSKIREWINGSGAESGLKGQNGAIT